MVVRNSFYHSFIHEKQKLRLSLGIYEEVGQKVRTADSKSLSLSFFLWETKYPDTEKAEEIGCLRRGDRELQSCYTQIENRPATSRRHRAKMTDS